MNSRYPWRRRRSPGEEAGRWLVMLLSSNPSQRLIRRWQKWILLPANKEAFDQAEMDWEFIGGVRPARPTDAELIADRYDGTVSVDEYRRQKTVKAHRPRNSGPAWISLAAGVIMAIGLGVTVSVLIDSNDHRVNNMTVFETPSSQHEQVVLADGSQISMGARTSVTTNVTRSVRYIVMDRGEALFKVAHDSRRPFRVLAGGGIITAVGTAFNVRRLDGIVIVTVTDGTVEIAPASAVTSRDAGDFPSGTRVHKGEEVSYDAEGNLGEVKKVDPNVALSWRAGRLQYLREPLSRVVQDVNRYAEKTIVIADQAAADRRYSGTVFQRDIDDWLFALNVVFPDLQVVAPDSTHVVIRTKEEEARIVNGKTPPPSE